MTRSRWLVKLTPARAKTFVSGAGVFGLEATTVSVLELTAPTYPGVRDLELAAKAAGLELHRLPDEATP